MTSPPFATLPKFMCVWLFLEAAEPHLDTSTTTGQEILAAKDAIAIADMVTAIAALNRAVQAGFADGHQDQPITAWIAAAPRQLLRN